VYRLARKPYKNVATETLCIKPPVISTAAVITETLKLLNLRPALYILTQKAALLNTCSEVGKILAEQ